MSKIRHKKKASGGSITMSGGSVDGGGNPNVVKEAHEKKKGGRVHLSMKGAKAKHRLDRPGRKSGGRVGADKSPLTGAHKDAGGAKTDTGGPFEAPK